MNRLRPERPACPSRSGAPFAGTGARRAIRSPGKPDTPVRTRLAAILGLFVFGCATLPATTGGINYSGRFTLRVDGADRHETDSGRFALTVKGPEVTLDLSTPLGTTMARVECGPGGARVTVPSAGGLRSTWGPDPDALSLQVLGWSLPISGIGDWIEGRPAAGRPYRLGPVEGGVAQLEQDGWTIRFEPPGADGHLRRLDLSRPQHADAPAVRLRVVLDSGDGS